MPIEDPPIEDAPIEDAPIEEAARIHRLERVQLLPLPVDEVFAFFADPFNLERITPPRLRFTIVRAPAARLSGGSLLDYRLSLRGVPFRWLTRISDWQPGVRFIDEALRSPYRLWHHTHDFRGVTEGTLVQDTVRYALPLQPLGELAGPWVARELDDIFDYRAGAVASILSEAAPWSHRSPLEMDPV